MESRTGLQLPVSWHSPFLAPRLNGTPGAGGAHGELRYWGIRFAFICLPAARSVLGAQPGEPSPHVLCPGLAQWVTKGTDAGTQGWVSGSHCLLAPRAPWGPSGGPPRGCAPNPFQPPAAASGGCPRDGTGPGSTGRSGGLGDCRARGCKGAEEQNRSLAAEAIFGASGATEAQMSA